MFSQATATKGIKMITHSLTHKCPLLPKSVPFLRGKNLEDQGSPIILTYFVPEYWVESSKSLSGDGFI